MMNARRLIIYLWTLPTTAVGLLFVFPTLLSGGSMRRHTGVLELSGGAVRFFLRHGTLLRNGAAAMTLGHVVLGQDQDDLDRTRTHERVHVRQAERWGPLFIPAYLIASVIQKLLGRHPYFDNPFEREAYATDKVPC